MKFLTLIAAALVAATGTAATAAPAPALAAAAAAPAATAAGQDRVIIRDRRVGPGARNTRVVVRQRQTVRRNYGARNRWRNVCRTTVRFGEHRRVCRRTRY